MKHAILGARSITPITNLEQVEKALTMTHWQPQQITGLQLMQKYYDGAPSPSITAGKLNEAQTAFHMEVYNWYNTKADITDATKKCYK